MTPIVTNTYRYKRPPRKKQAAPLTGPAVVTQRARPNTGAPKPTAVTAPPPANDDREPAPLPTGGKKSAIVTTASRKQLKQRRAAGAPDDADDPEAAAAMRAWLEKAKWGRGPAG